MIGGKQSARLLAIATCALSLLLVASPQVLAQQNGTTLSESVSATGHMVRTFAWTIEKSASPASWSLFVGDTGTTGYTITVTKDEGTDSYRVDGQICVTNGGAEDTEDLTITAEVQYNPGGGTGFLSLVTAPVDVSAMPTIAAGATFCYAFSVPFTPPSGNPAYRVIGHVTITNHSGHLGTPFGPNEKTGFNVPSSPDILINDTVHVGDTNGGSWTFSASGSQSYTKTFACNADQGAHNNTATITETGQSASASVTVACYALQVAKTAQTSLTRTYDWTINKAGDQSSLTLATGESFDVNYTVTVNASYADSNWAAYGVISVFNPAPIAATVDGVADLVSPAIGAAPSCGVGFPLSLPAGATLNCTYAVSLPDATARTNTATAGLQNFSYDSAGNPTPTGITPFSGTAGVDFGSAQVTHVNRCITITDSLQGELGALCYGDLALPKTFTYTRTIGPYAACGSYSVTNTASFNGDNGAAGSAEWTVNVNVPCAGGCTLTQGYWKTHSQYGPAPYYDTWGQIGADTPFYSSGQSWYQVLWTAPQGGNAYYILAHQFIAAELNGLNGAASPSAVGDALGWADAFFGTHTPTSTLSKQVRNMALTYAALLDQYNNGQAVGGPPHCSE